MKKGNTLRKVMLLAGVMKAMTVYAEVQAQSGAWPWYGVSSPDIVFSSRLGVDQKARVALEEYRADATFSQRLSGQFRLMGTLGYVTERRLDRQPFSGLDVQNLYVRHKGQACTVSTGMQQVVWGKADQLQVLDVIQSLDLRESYFGEWERKRLPLTMLNAECGSGEQSLQLIVAPQTRFDRLPSAQGRFALPSVADQLAAIGVPVTSGHAPHPGKLSDWSGGVQWSGRAWDADVTLNAYQGWQSQYRLVPDAMGPGYHQEPARFRLLGSSFARPFGPVVVRAEVARTFGLTGYIQPDGLPVPVSFNQNSYLAGIDWVGDPWTVSAQYLQRSQAGGADLVTPGPQRTVTLAVRRHFLQDRLHLKLFCAWDRNRPAEYLSLSAAYEATDRLSLKISLEKFIGHQDSFGAFSAQSRLMLGFKYHLR